MRKKCAIRESCSTGGAIKIFSHNCGENLWYFDKQLQPISGLCGVWSFYSFSWEFSARLMILRFAVDLHCCWHSNMRLPLKTGSRGWRKNNGATSTLVVAAWNHESVKRDERTRWGCGTNLRNASRMREDHLDFSRFAPFELVRVEKQIVNLKEIERLYGSFDVAHSSIGPRWQSYRCSDRHRLTDKADNRHSHQQNHSTLTSYTKTKHLVLHWADRSTPPLGGIMEN